jgi:2-polyprenyl-6-methoxyphenol hydroxylase-like FAD-dependent oxidoreductase
MGLAHWLTKNGYRVIVVEIAKGIRPGGQTVDLRGAGGEVVERMGLMPQMREHALVQHGVAWVGADGVDVTFADNTKVRADLVVGADGPHSAVRGMVFGPEDQFVAPLGGYNAWFSAPDHVGLDGWYLMYLAPGGLNASMRPTHDPAKAKAGLAFASEPIDYDRHDIDQQRQLLIDRFAGAGWQCDALLTAAQEADDFYFDSFLQVRVPAWTSGRVALVGDAGYCASPLSGMGTSLALVGAYLLAGELGPANSFGAQSIQEALHRYEAKMRPYVDKCQDIPNRVDARSPPGCGSRSLTRSRRRTIRDLHAARQHPAELQQSLHLSQPAVVDRLLEPERLTEVIGVGRGLLVASRDELGVHPKADLRQSPRAVAEDIELRRQDVVGDRRQQNRPHRRVEHLTLMLLAHRHVVVGAPHDQPAAVGQDHLLGKRFAPRCLGQPP